jgi:hypothetical protein
VDIIVALLILTAMLYVIAKVLRVLRDRSRAEGTGAEEPPQARPAEPPRTESPGARAPRPDRASSVQTSPQPRPKSQPTAGAHSSPAPHAAHTSHTRQPPVARQASQPAASAPQVPVPRPDPPSPARPQLAGRATAQAQTVAQRQEEARRATLGTCKHGRSNGEYCPDCNRELLESRKEFIRRHGDWQDD